MKKTILQRILIGFNLLFKLPSLPHNIQGFHTHPLVRILRVIGGICIVLFLSSFDWIQELSFYGIIFVLAMLQFLYILFISVTKIIYIIYLWKNKKLEVRNSPLDRVASLTVKLGMCVKGVCAGGAGSATVLGLGFGADKLLEEAGYTPFFKKTLGKGLGNILSTMGYKNNSEYLELQKNMEQVRNRVKNIDDLQKVVDDIEKDKSFSELHNDIKEFKNEFSKELNKEKIAKQASESKILEQLNYIKKNK